MTMGPVEIERKVRQLDNDVQSIYTMLSAIQGTQERHTNRLGELAVKVDALDGKVDALDLTDPQHSRIPNAKHLDERPLGKCGQRLRLSDRSIDEVVG